MQLAFQLERLLFAVDASQSVGEQGGTEQVHEGVGAASGDGGQSNDNVRNADEKKLLADAVKLRHPGINV